MTQHKDQRVGVFVDVQNMYYSAKQLYNAKVNYTNILKTAVAGRQLIRAITYVIKADVGEEEDFFDALEKIGFEVRSKDLQVFFGGAKKGDWDVGIAMDILRLASKLDVVVLVSGDGDFKDLVEHVKSLGCRAEVIAFGKTSSSRIKSEVDMFVDMDKEKQKYLLHYHERREDQKNHADMKILPERRPAEVRPPIDRPIEAKAPEDKVAEIKPVENKPVEARTFEAKAAESRPVESRPADNRPPMPFNEQRRNGNRPSFGGDRRSGGFRRDDRRPAGGRFQRRDERFQRPNEDVSFMQLINMDQPSEKKNAQQPQPLFPKREPVKELPVQKEEMPKAEPPKIMERQQIIPPRQRAQPEKKELKAPPEMKGAEPPQVKPTEPEKPKKAASKGGSLLKKLVSKVKKEDQKDKKAK